jgi:hypothetical protein
MPASSPSKILQVRGSALRSRLLWVKEQYGTQGLVQLERELSAAGRFVLHENVDPRAWYNFPLFVEIGTVMDRLWGNGELSLNIELGRYGARVGTPWLYQPFIRLGSIDWVLQRASKLWAELFTAGAFLVKHEPGQSRAEGEIVEFPATHMVLVYSCLGFSMGCIELSGGKNVTGEVVSARARGAERDLLRVSWA